METILVVDDDPDVRLVAVEALEQHGYTVLNAASVSGVLALISTVSKIDLVLTDIHLPGVRWDELSSAIRELLPGSRLVCMSGSPNQGVPAVRLPFGHAFIQKPFTAIDLLAVIRLALAVGPPGSSI